MQLVRTAPARLSLKTFQVRLFVIQRPRLRRRRPAHVNAAQHEEDEDDDRQDGGDGDEPVLPGEAVVPSRGEFGRDQAAHQDVAAEHEGEHEAGDEARDEEFADAHIADDPVDEHRHAGRYHEPQRPRPGQGSDGKIMVVPPFLQFGHGDLADGGRRGRRRAADGGKERTGQDVHVDKPPRNRIHPGRFPPSR
jgi:hypothetical protein